MFPSCQKARITYKIHSHKSTVDLDYKLYITHVKSIKVLGRNMRHCLGSTNTVWTINTKRSAGDVKGLVRHSTQHCQGVWGRWGVTARLMHYSWHESGRARYYGKVHVLLLRCSRVTCDSMTHGQQYNCKPESDEAVKLIHNLMTRKNMKK